MEKNKLLLKLFCYYSYFTHLGQLCSDLCPPFVRTIFHKFIFRSFGVNNMIDYRTYFRYPSKIEIGSNVTINRGTNIYGSHFVKEAVVVIGNNVAIGPEVKMFSASHDYTSLDLPNIAQSIIVNDNCWIGGGAILLPGVELGEGVVIGAGSVVSCSIPAWSIAVGNPASIIKHRSLSEYE